MATAKVLVYPYVVLNEKGENPAYGVNTYKQEDYFSKEYKIFHLGLPPVEIEVFAPDEAALRNGAAQLLDKTMADERAKFHAQQTLMQSIKNDLLRLEHADVLDAEPMRGRSADVDGAVDADDDIPF